MGWAGGYLPAPRPRPQIIPRPIPRHRGIFVPIPILRGKSVPLQMDKLDSGAMQIGTHEGDGSGKGGRLPALLRPQPPAAVVACGHLRRKHRSPYEHSSALCDVFYL
ncbi:hypothetical protein PIB30_018341 [Stylosanthes scabra]|uniref:Uncharacterized protein n=1 Tax=Stylosanthes scabra TaxID=79078 RepID=A0ABU6Q7Z0_9FABA|nr:hypothetical protein [Stylosanthes scabra]